MAALAARKIEPALMPEQIRERIAAARTRYESLTASQAAIAERSLQDEAAEREYAKVIEEMTAASADIERMELALTGMQRKAAERLQADQLAEQSALCARVSKILDQRTQAAKAFTLAIGEAVRSFREMVDLSDKAFMAWPSPQQPSGAAFSNAELVALAAAEMFKQGHVVPITGRPPTGRREIPPLPAPKAPGLEFLELPERVKPLAESIEEANAFAKTLLEG